MPDDRRSDVSILTTDEVAAYLRLHRNTVLRRAAELGGVKIGRDWRFRRMDVDRLFAAVPREEPCHSTDESEAPIGGASSSFLVDRQYEKALARRTAPPRRNGTPIAPPDSGDKPSSANVLSIRGSKRS